MRDTERLVVAVVPASRWAVVQSPNRPPKATLPKLEHCATLILTRSIAPPTPSRVTPQASDERQTAPRCDLAMLDGKGERGC